MHRNACGPPNAVSRPCTAAAALSPRRRAPTRRHCSNGLCANKLADALQKNKTLTSLDLDGNSRITTELTNRIKNSLSQPRALPSATR